MLGNLEMNVTFAPALPHKKVHLVTEKQIKKSFQKNFKKDLPELKKRLSLHPARE